MSKVFYSPDELRYLKLLAKQFPTLHDASNEAIRLETILNLPKGTEHFMSDIHGEHEAFFHILNSNSGEVKEKLKDFFEDTLSEEYLSDLATLIYYPEAKMTLISRAEENTNDWYTVTLDQFIRFCKFVSVKHTRAKVRSYIPEGYEHLIDELLNLCDDGQRAIVAHAGHNAALAGEQRVVDLRAPRVHDGAENDLAVHGNRTVVCQ